VQAIVASLLEIRIVGVGKKRSGSHIEYDGAGVHPLRGRLVLRARVRKAARERELVRRLRERLSDREIQIVINMNIRRRMMIGKMKI
jgi:hypothetical protein